MSCEAEAAESECTRAVLLPRGDRKLRGRDLLKFAIQTAALFVVTFASTAWPASTSLDAKAIIQRSVQANDADWKAAPEYEYFERDQQPGGGTKTYQVLMIDGSPYQRLVEVDGKPVSQTQQEQEQQKLNAVVNERKNESPTAKAKRIQQYEKDRKRDHGLMQQLVDAFDFQLQGEQQLDGFEVYVLLATPRAGYQPPSRDTRVLTGMHGKLWIDKKTFQWVKVEAEVIHPVSIEGFLAEVEPGTRFELEKMPVGDGVWQAKHFSMKAHAKILEVFNHREQDDETYYGYHKPASGNAGVGAETEAMEQKSDPAAIGDVTLVGDSGAVVGSEEQN